MGGGKSGGGQSQSGPSPEQRETSRFFLENVIKPLSGTLIPQVQTALQTGRPTAAQIPLVGARQEATRRAASKATSQTIESLARARLSGTPFGERTLAQTRMAGEQAVEAVPIEVAQALAGLAPGFIQGGGQISIGGPGFGQQRQFGQDTLGPSLAQAGGAIGSSALLYYLAAAAAASCWIAAAIYGDNTTEFYLARYWIVYKWEGRTANVVRWVYRLIGLPVSLVVKRSPLLKRMLRPLFDIAVQKGRQSFNARR